MKKIFVAAVLSAWIVPAFAAAATAPEKGFYAGVDVGNGKARLKDCGTGGCGSPTKNDQVVGGILLGYQYNKNIAVEAKFTGIGKWEDNTVPGDVKADAFALVGVGIVPVTDEFNIYGKLGVAYIKSKVSNSTAMGIKDTRNTSATLGLGAQYNVTPAIGVRLGYDYYKGKADSTGGGNDIKLNCDVWTAGVIFRF